MQGYCHNQQVRTDGVQFGGGGGGEEAGLVGLGGKVLFH